MKRRTLFLIQLIFLFMPNRFDRKSLITQMDSGLKIRRVGGTNIQMVVFPEINGSKLMEGIISSMSTAIS